MNFIFTPRTPRTEIKKKNLLQYKNYFEYVSEIKFNVLDICLPNCFLQNVDLLDLIISTERKCKVFGKKKKTKNAFNMNN